MSGKMEDRLVAYYNGMQGRADLEKRFIKAVLISEVKTANKGRDITKEEAYEAMRLAADNLHIQDPFEGIGDFYQAYIHEFENLHWEDDLYYVMKVGRQGAGLVPDLLFTLMTDHIMEETQSILIAEGEKFVPNLKTIVDNNEGRIFTITSSNPVFCKAMEWIFDGYENVTICNTDIYRYGFLNERFDFILSVPAFGTRDLAADSENFICREYEMVALENLLLHIGTFGKLAIVMPARITFAGGRVNDLRKFVTQMYKLEELAELPDGIFQNTGIKTFLLVIGDGRTEDVVIRRYEAVGRKTKRSLVKALELKEDTFAMADELEEIGDWSIDKLLTQQDEEFMRYQASDTRKILLGEVAEIFRGKSVTKKDENGSIGVVNISNIGQYDIDYDGLDKLNEEERKVHNYILQEGDVVLPARGTAIRTAVFHEQSYLCIASSNIIVIRPKPSMLNSTYLKIFMDSPIGNSMISSLQQGMTVMNISYKDLKLLEIPFPVIEEQQRISKEYTDSYKDYIESISAAEKRWQETLSRLQTF